MQTWVPNTHILCLNFITVFSFCTRNCIYFCNLSLVALVSESLKELQFDFQEWYSPKAVYCVPMYNWNNSLIYIDWNTDHKRDEAGLWFALKWSADSNPMLQGQSNCPSLEGIWWKLLAILMPSFLVFAPITLFVFLHLDFNYLNSVVTKLQNKTDQRKKKNVDKVKRRSGWRVVCYDRNFS